MDAERLSDSLSSALGDRAQWAALTSWGASCPHQPSRHSSLLCTNLRVSVLLLFFPIHSLEKRNVSDHNACLSLVVFCFWRPASFPFYRRVDDSLKKKKKKTTFPYNGNNGFQQSRDIICYHTHLKGIGWPKFSRKAGHSKLQTMEQVHTYTMQNWPVGKLASFRSSGISSMLVRMMLKTRKIRGNNHAGEKSLPVSGWTNPSLIPQPKGRKLHVSS